MSDPIQTARESALAVLKPSQRDLEHGLELHRELLVVESYGLPPKAPVLPSVLDKAREAGASAGELLDLYEEMSTLRWACDADLKAEYRTAWDAAGVDAVLINAGQESNQPMRLLQRLSRFTRLASLLPEFLQLATSVDVIRAGRLAGKRTLSPAFCGVPLAGRFENVEDELSYLSTFAHLGVRVMHLTYNRRNPIGDGCGERHDGGLSDFGAAAVREMNRLGIVIDLAHCGQRTSLEAARASQQPVIVSHSAAFALNPHVRGKTDEVIRAVVDSGGTLGITNIPPFLGGAGDITVFLNHIDYVAENFGTESVTIGTDRSYYARGFREAAAKVSLPALRQPWEHLWPAADAHGMPDWQTSEAMQTLAWTNWPLFTVGLVQRGYSDEDIQKILGENILRVVGEVWNRSIEFGK